MLGLELTLPSGPSTIGQKRPQNARVHLGLACLRVYALIRVRLQKGKVAAKNSAEII